MPHKGATMNLSSEPPHVKINDGSDRDWRLISMYELQKIEYAINEECVGYNDGCPLGHLKEMHDSGNETIDKVRARPTSSVLKRISDIRTEERNDTLNDMRDAIRNAKRYGSIEPEELFHWTGIIAIIDSLRRKEES
jgi:hypothetical protein